MHDRTILRTALVALTVWSQVVVAAFSVCGCCRAVAVERPTMAADAACCEIETPRSEAADTCPACRTGAGAAADHVAGGASPVGQQTPGRPAGCCLLADYVGQFVGPDGFSVGWSLLGLAVAAIIAVVVPTVVGRLSLRRTEVPGRLRRHARLSVWRN